MDEAMTDVPFEAQEIDLDYEFDAPQFFDFTRPELSEEAQEAECWFESAESYSPSPFIVELCWKEDSSLENEKTYPQCKDVKNANLINNNSDTGMDTETSALDEKNRGRIWYLHVHDAIQLENGFLKQLTVAFGLRLGLYIPKAKAKSLFKSKSCLSRTSTFMKPTASHLAKQNQLWEFHSSEFMRRLRKPLLGIDEKGSNNRSMIENQATKRQKIEGGFLHKAVTIPREPDLETAHRAQRHRLKKDALSNEPVKSNAHSFKARPLNRKILEAPSLLLTRRSRTPLPEFNVLQLKSSQGIPKHTSDHVVPLLIVGVNPPNSSSISQNPTIDSKRPDSVNASKQEICDIVHKVRVYPLKKKIFSSKLGLGVFRNIKQEAIVPVEFKFPTDDGLLHDPPIELFSKLSLKSEVKSSQPKMLHPNKGSKENAPGPFHQEHGMINVVKENPQRSWGNQNQCGTGMRIPKFETWTNVNR
ncbi:Protein TPX2 [Vitis vinifera]|uniref:Protein TPX2 n=1 Tax=Vitis vinifera TaxID=29760 RepID=A0A438JGZ5_VITVI|nr:Protein TPX2 [Vitis vinifera]